MDPNETLKAIRELITDVHDGKINNPELLDMHLDALVSCVEALDGWLSKGGFAPDAWASVQQLNTPAGPTDKGPCTATVRVNTKTMVCELDAPHPGWSHTNIDSRRTIHWCSDAEAEAVVVE